MSIGVFQFSDTDVIPVCATSAPNVPILRVDCLPWNGDDVVYDGAARVWPSSYFCASKFRFADRMPVVSQENSAPVTLQPVAVFTATVPERYGTPIWNVSGFLVSAASVWICLYAAPVSTALELAPPVSDSSSSPMTLLVTSNVTDPDAPLTVST